MKNTIATIFSNDDLANIYSILLRDEKIEIFYIENSESLRSCNPRE